MPFHSSISPDKLNEVAPSGRRKSQALPSLSLRKRWESFTNRFSFTTYDIHPSDASHAKNAKREAPTPTPNSAETSHHHQPAAPAKLNYYQPEPLPTDH